MMTMPHPELREVHPGKPVRVSVVIVCYNHKAYLTDCIRSLEGATLREGSFRVILVDNASTDGSAEFITTELLVPDGSKSTGGLNVVFLPQQHNLGFTGGNNLAIRRALADGDDFVYLLNPDTEVRGEFLEQAVRGISMDASIAICQSMLLLHPDVNRVNSLGNEIHFLGFGYSAGENALLADVPVDPFLRDIGFASGAGMLVRCEALKEIGLFADDLFVYGEDLELSWRARLAGWRVVCFTPSIVYHKYEFSRSMRSYVYMEANRWKVLLRCYHGLTLAVVAPPLLAMEIALWVRAAGTGAIEPRARAWRNLLSPRSMAATRRARQHVQTLRRRPDRDIVCTFAAHLPHQALTNPAAKGLNKALSFYWQLVQKAIVW